MTTIWKDSWTTIVMTRRKNQQRRANKETAKLTPSRNKNKNNKNHHPHSALVAPPKKLATPPSFGPADTNRRDGAWPDRTILVHPPCWPFYGPPRFISFATPFTTWDGSRAAFALHFRSRPRITCWTRLFGIRALWRSTTTMAPPLANDRPLPRGITVGATCVKPTSHPRARIVPTAMFAWKVTIITVPGWVVALVKAITSSLFVST
mmetsp:Transcript_6521/g.14583  ORF Transcript_6521/g.14583 Transcript_6521/m.14583 type:complete len:207 (-) Transcript_6521:234-854(-)